jgi:hypothetical protein
LSTEKALVTGNVQIESGKIRGKYDYLIDIIEGIDG